jgi:hypothetical protein
MGQLVGIIPGSVHPLVFMFVWHEFVGPGAGQFIRLEGLAGPPPAIIDVFDKGQYTHQQGSQGQMPERASLWFAGP